MYEKNMFSMDKEWIDWLFRIKWLFVFLLLSAHVSAVKGLFILLTEAKWQTIITCYILSVLAGIGVLAGEFACKCWPTKLSVRHPTGAHRFFSHRSFKANRRLTLLLCVLQTLSGQKSAIDWALDHQTHHKFEGTNADAVSLGRGFFFAHIGWIMIERHPECEEKRNKIDVDYLWSDPIVKYQHNYYLPLFLVFNALIPTLIPHLLFGETLINSFYTCFIFRYVYTMQLALSGNSFAHIFGYREYDVSSSSTHNKALNYLTLGGAYHNYHHAFPLDYSASEFGIKSFNIYAAFIEFFAWIGWAYDLKKTPQKYVDLRKKRTGGEEDKGALYKSHTIIDWIVGWFVSFNVIWTVLIYRGLQNLF